MPNLLTIAKLNGSDKVAGLIEESQAAHPEISGIIGGAAIPNVGWGRTIRGTQYKTLIRTGLPTVAFRNVNEGASASGSTFENRLVETFVLNPRFEVDKAVADAYEDGWEAFLALEASGQMEAAMRLLASQFYYGRAGDAKGHPGLIDSYDATNYVVDAGGTTATTGSSVWLVKFGPQDVAWVFGQDGGLSIDDVRVESITDGSSNRYTAYVQELLAYVGVQVGSVNSVCRIKKLTADSGKGLTDDLIYDALSKFPAGIVPDAIFMSRRSQKQLRESRTATNATGAPAPIPREVEGIPIAVTDAISNTEALSL